MLRRRWRLCPGALYATNIGGLTPLGLEGWRFAFLSVAVVSALIGGLTFFLGHDPRFEDDRCGPRVRAARAQCLP